MSAETFAAIVSSSANDDEVIAKMKEHLQAAK